MAGRYRLTANVGCPAPPDPERSAVIVVPIAERAGFAPQDQRWAGDASAGASIFSVVLGID
jgi:hypothetical protein